MSNSFLSSLTGCGAGVTIYYVDKGLMAAKNPGQRTKLDPIAKEIMNEFFSDVDLDKVRLRLKSTLIAYGSPRAMTFCHLIYWRSSSFDACRKKDMDLLMHELVHVRQCEEDGETKFACKYGAGAYNSMDYELTPYEEEAIEFTRVRRGILYDKMKDHPLCSGKIEEEQRRLTSSDDWDWLVWG